MTRKSIFIVAAALLLALPGAAQKPDAPGCKDPALFPVRMPKYRLEVCEHKTFAFYEFATAKPPKRRVEGEFSFIQYGVEDARDSRSGLEVVRNYENALKKIGGTIQASSDWWVTGTVTLDGKQVWTEVSRGNSKIWIRIVKQQEMEQIIVADATAFSRDLKNAGHVAVSGIYFDTASAVLKAESAPAIGEIAKMLKGDPNLKVYVVGHTDTVGNLDANLKLSRDRAEAVARTLTADHGIAAARLKPFGNGPFAPVASNASEDGRAMNRRVELVMQ